MLDHFHQTHHRQRIQRKAAVDSRRDHARPTDTTKLYLRITRLECLHQAGTQQITGHLSGHDIDPCKLTHDRLTGETFYRIMPRVDTSMEAAKSSVSGSVKRLRISSNA